MAAMESRLDGLNDSDNYARESKMKADLFRSKNDGMMMAREYIKLGWKYKRAKASGNIDNIDDFKFERNMVKKQIWMHAKQYNELKARLGYESASCLSASLVDQDDQSKGEEDNNSD